ncbi:hypothetical protein ADK86_21140 [Streptomyces sp. NRRL F-5755]|uniref:hypothetical protein n=1 Tax=Streptomyces sp. NRRL F-5755 TaxID=1519475 RepID=UPI0006AF2F63|nr:hypothetical protein [Streptomyces sp. NRRL F-5755]KOT92163.1 hypothetical protein ADK86_21140 [Streptomyces sp. NRRL F-5755]
MTPPATVPAGTVTTVAGTGAAGFDGGGGPAVQARLNGPRIALDPSGNLCVPEVDNHRVHKVSTDGVGKHAPVRISAEITGGSQDEPALRPAQESVPEAKPGDSVSFNIEIRSLNNQPVDPGTPAQRFTAPTSFAFTGGAPYGYYFVRPAVTGNLRTQLEDGGRTLITISDLHLNTGATDRTALIHTSGIRALPDAAPGSRSADGSAAIGRPAPVPLSAHVLRPRQEQRS